jgi:hypothetical protein
MLRLHDFGVWGSAPRHMELLILNMQLRVLNVELSVLNMKLRINGCFGAQQGDARRLTMLSGEDFRNLEGFFVEFWGIIFDFHVNPLLCDLV